MRDLRDFSVPSRNSVCLCEVDGRLHFADDSYVGVDSFTQAVRDHPKIHITNDILHPVFSGDAGRALFLPVNISFLKQFSQIYYEQGFTDALQATTHHNQVIISKTASILYNLVKYVQKVNLFLKPLANYKELTTINDYCQTRNWANHLVRCLVWHPYSCKIAVCTSDDSVRVYSNENTSSFVLRCRQQRNVTCLAWRPLSNSELAVGHENGIIVWNVEPHSLVLRPSASNATILYRVDHKPVISLSWSPRGNLLVSAAACDNTLYVWDVELDQTSSLKRPGSTGNTLVKWSPSGEKLFSATNGIIFRVWDCQRWQCERWTVLTGRVQTSCWTSCGTHLLFATDSEPVIYSLRVKSDVVFRSDVDFTQDQAFPLFDLTKIEVDGTLIGGSVQAMEIDPKGNTLAVLFQTTNAIAIFHIAKKHPLELIASSLVMGQNEEIPTCMSFQQDFKAGACLTIGWSSGRVQNFPIIYSDLAENIDNTLNNQTHVNRTQHSFQSF